MQPVEGRPMMMRSFTRPVATMPQDGPAGAAALPPSRSAARVWARSILATSAYVAGMVAVTVLPMNVFLRLTETPSLGVIDGGVLQFTEAGIVGLLLLVGALLLGSVVVGGIGKSLLRRRFVHGPVLLLVGMVLLWILISTLDEVRQLEADLSNIRGGDNGKAAAFVAYWAVMVSYCGKAVWDEIRDRVSDRIDRHFG